MATQEPDLFGPEANRRWYQTYRELRERAPVYRVPETSLFVLTRYDDIAMVVRDSDRFSTVAITWLGATTANSASAGNPLASIIADTRSAVGGTTESAIEPKRSPPYRR